MITFEQTPFAEVKLFRFDGVTDNRGFKIRAWSRVKIFYSTELILRLWKV